MVDRLVRRALAPLAFAAFLLAPTQAGAAVYLFTLTGNGTTSTFNLNSSPAPNASISTDFNVNGIAATYNGSPTIFDLIFYTSGVGGGFDVNAQGFGSIYSLVGAQLFTGTTASPTFILGTFPLSTFGSDNDLLYSVTISASAGVPEPAAWAMMLLGFAAIGLVMRRQTPRLA